MLLNISTSCSTFAARLGASGGIHLLSLPLPSSSGESPPSGLESSPSSEEVSLFLFLVFLYFFFFRFFLSSPESSLLSSLEVDFDLFSFLVCFEDFPFLPFFLSSSESSLESLSDSSFTFFFFREGRLCSSLSSSADVEAALLEHFFFFFFLLPLSSPPSEKPSEEELDSEGRKKRFTILSKFLAFSDDVPSCNDIFFTLLCNFGFVIFSFINSCSNTSATLLSVPKSSSSELLNCPPSQYSSA